MEQEEINRAHPTAASLPSQFSGEGMERNEFVCVGEKNCTCRGWVLSREWNGTEPSPQGEYRFKAVPRFAVIFGSVLILRDDLTHCQNNSRPLTTSMTNDSFIHPFISSSFVSSPLPFSGPVDRGSRTIGQIVCGSSGTPKNIPDRAGWEP